MFRKISSAFRTVANTVTQPKVLVRALLLGAVISASLLTGCVERSNLGFGGESNSVSFAQPKSTGSEIQQREARAQAYWQGREDALEEEAMMQGGGGFGIQRPYGSGGLQIDAGGGPGLNAIYNMCRQNRDDCYGRTAQMKGFLQIIRTNKAIYQYNGMTGRVTVYKP